MGVAPMVMADDLLLDHLLAASFSASSDAWVKLALANGGAGQRIVGAYCRTAFRQRVAFAGGALPYKCRLSALVRFQ